jgi:DNA-binding protein HU-beta
MEFQELVTVLSRETKYTKREIRRILLLFADIVGRALEEGRDIQVYNLGRFKNLESGARSGRHPVTGERIPIPPSRRIKFDPIPMLRERVKKSADLFKKESLETRYGLPRKEKQHGKVRSGNRPRQGTKREEGRGG